MRPLGNWIGLDRALEYLRNATGGDYRAEDIIALARGHNLKVILNARGLPDIGHSELDWVLVCRGGIYNDYGGERLQNYASDGVVVVGDYALRLLEDCESAPLSICRIRLEDGSEYMPNTKATFGRRELKFRTDDVVRFVKELPPPAEQSKGPHPNPPALHANTIDEPTESRVDRIARIGRRKNELKAKGVRAWLEQLASEEGLSRSRIKQLLKRSSPGDSPLSIVGQLGAASKSKGS